MFIRCPACQTLFRIQPQQLKAARGQVRCGSCQAVFDGLDFLVNREELSREEQAALAKPPQPASRQWQLPFDEAPATPPASETPAAEDTEELAAAAPPPAATPVEIPAGSPAEIPAETPGELAPDDVPAVLSVEAIVPAEAAATPAPAEEPQHDEPPAEKPFKWSPRYSLANQEPAAAPPRPSRLGWGLASLLMLAVLAGQLIWFNHATLALDPRWRPWLQQACDMAGCVLPPLRDPHAIEMVDRNVQSHPKYQQALLITATLVNQAPFAQPYPEVELTMTDLDQKPVAARRFKPGEYLDHVNGQGLIAPGASVRLRLEIADPGQQAVGFEFEFY